MDRSFLTCVKNTFIHAVADTGDGPPRSSSSPPAGSSGVPADKAPDPCLSVGSAMHFSGTCQPCAWRWRVDGGCTNGSSCRFCHVCVDGSIKKRRQAKLRDVREAARVVTAQKEAPKQASKPSHASQQMQKQNVMAAKKPAAASTDTFDWSAVSLTDLFNEVQKRSKPTHSVTDPCTGLSAASTTSRSTSSSSTASPRSSLSSGAGNSSVHDCVTEKWSMRPWNRDRKQRDMLRAKLGQQ